MSAGKGSMVLLKIGDGATPAETFTTIGGLRMTKTGVNRQLIAADTVDGDGWRRILSECGSSSVRIQAEGIFHASAAEQLLRAQALAGSLASYKMYFSNGDILEGAFLVTAYERSGKVGEMEAFSVTLESAGNVTYQEM